MLIKYGTPAQKARYLPQLATERVRDDAMPYPGTLPGHDVL